MSGAYLALYRVAFQTYSLYEFIIVFTLVKCSKNLTKSKTQFFLFVLSDPLDPDLYFMVPESVASFWMAALIWSNPLELIG